MPESVKKLDLQINPESKQMTIGDAMTLLKAQAGEDVSALEVMSLLDHMVIGGIKKVPLDAIEDVMQAVVDYLNQQSNPQDGQGN